MKPITSAETDSYWEYWSADLNAIRNIFDEQICNVIKESQAFRETGGVGMRLPKQNYQDAIILLKNCLDSDTIKILFASTRNKTPPLPGSPENIQENVSDITTAWSHKNSSDLIRES